MKRFDPRSCSKDVFAAKKIDLPLTHLGIQQTEAQVKILKNISFEKIYTSPLLRAKQTAEIIGKSCDIVPIISNCLSEIDIGILDGKHMKDPHYWGIWEKTIQKWKKVKLMPVFQRVKHLMTLKSGVTDLLKEYEIPISQFS